MNQPNKPFEGIITYECKSCMKKLKSDIVRSFCPSCYSTSYYEVKRETPDSLHVGETVEENTSIQHLPHVQEAADNYYNIIHSKHA